VKSRGGERPGRGERPRGVWEVRGQSVEKPGDREKTKTKTSNK
jgi:hypothetical protein